MSVNRYRYRTGTGCQKNLVKILIGSKSLFCSITFLGKGGAVRRKMIPYGTGTQFFWESYVFCSTSLVPSYASNSRQSACHIFTQASADDKTVFTSG